MENQEQRKARFTIVKEPEPLFPSARAQLDMETPEQKKAAAKKSKAIDAYLREEGKKFDPANHLNVLLLGPGDAGKSTVLKQLIMQNGGYAQKDREDMAELIQRQVYTAAIKLIRLEKAVNYFPIASTIMAAGYVPTDDDILQSRRKTENISETVLEMDGKFWHFVDVAGQKDKRSRWTAYMEKNVSGVLYVFSCSSYNQVLEEQHDLNRIVDALQLYQSIITNPLLKLRSVIILFNKFDLLDDKLRQYQIRDYLKDYPSVQEKGQYIKWLMEQFQKPSLQHKVDSFIFKTTATDKQLMNKVIASVRFRI
ncbi:G-protein alpha subunit-domain-containing protein [Gorgonomyces haynaldii]|nr:G-protein alpha subunit-domain-containing protein [Gorgonomyces haynaldii]